MALPPTTILTTDQLDKWRTTMNDILDVFTIDSNGAVTTVKMRPITLTDAATISWNTLLGHVAKVTITANRTMGAPTGLKDGGFYSLAVLQNGTGGYTLAWNSVFKFKSGTAPTTTTAANARDEYTFKSDGTNLYELGRNQDVK